MQISTHTPPFAWPRLDAAIEHAIAEDRLVGAVVLVAQHGKLAYARAAGFADREAATPMQPDAVFRLASVSKPFVTTAAMVLVEQGRLGLDDAVDSWLPDFRPRLSGGEVPTITVRQLMTHTAGLGYRFLEADADGPYARAGVSDGMDQMGISLAENLSRIAAVPLLYPPGTAWCYSLGIDVLGAVVEAVCGMPLAAAVHALVLAPLGLKDTGFHALAPERLAAAYVSSASRPRRMATRETVTPFECLVGISFDLERALDTTAYPSGGAGMVGTAGDFLAFVEALRQGGAPLLSLATVAEMGRNQTGAWGPADAPGSGFGLGFSVLHNPELGQSPESAGTWRWGGAYGHSWFVDPARGLSVVAFTNTLYEGMSGRFVTQVRDAVYA